MSLMLTNFLTWTNTLKKPGVKNRKGESKMEEPKVLKNREEITSKEEAIKSLEGLHIKIYSRLKGKGLGLIEKLNSNADE